MPRPGETPVAAVARFWDNPAMTAAGAFDELDLDGQEMLDDPHPIYDRLRAAEPVHWNRRMGVWFLTRYADVVAGVKDPALSSERISNFIRMLPPEVQVETAALERHLSTWMLFRDPPSHTRLRGITAKAFSPRVIRGLGERIDQIVAELMQANIGRGEMDVISDFSFHLPMILIAESLGVRPDDRMQFRHWLEAIELFVGIGRPLPDRALAACDGAVAIERYLQVILDDRRAHPRDDLISALVTADEDGTRLSDEEIMGTAAFLLMAGHETTMSLIAAAVHALLTHPDELARLRSDETLLDSAVEEALRYESVVHRYARFAIADTTIGDERIKAGQRVTLCIGAANRDPAVFPDPHRFDVARNPQRHIAFGHGPHYCVGALLGRMEIRSALRALLTLPNLRLAPGPLVRRKTLTIRAFEHLPVLWDPPR